MSDCTVADVLTKAMSVLGDASGEITQEIIDDFNTTYTDLIILAKSLASPFIVRDTYYTVPPSTGTIFPSSIGVNDFSEPQQVWARGNVTQLPIVGTTDGTPISITLVSVPTTALSGQIELQGVQGVPSWVNRNWYLSSTGNPLVYNLNGSVLCGSNGTGGSVNFSANGWIKLNGPSNQRPQTQGATLGSLPQNWWWQDNQLYLEASNQAVQLWISYLASSAPPASGIIGLAQGDEVNFLGYGTAARFAPKRMIAQGPAAAMAAYGPSGIPDGSGGMLWALLNQMVMQGNNRLSESRLFRQRRPFVSFIQ